MQSLFLPLQLSGAMTMKPALLAAFSLITGIFFPAASVVRQEERRPRPTQGLDPLIQRVVAECFGRADRGDPEETGRGSTKNTPIDQYVFGVKPVDFDGHESPVSAYWTAPRRSYQ